MISLKQKSKGFTIVELLIVIVVIAILATLVIVTFTGIQKKARDSQRQTDITAVASHLEAFYANNGYYPTLTDLTDTSTPTWLSQNMKGLDPQALISPENETIAGTAGNGGSTPGWAYGYATQGCTASSPSSSTNECTSFTLTANLEGSSTPFTKSSNT